jgi:succinate dehydrogenase / fumarate reductase cytochrome b subunit
MAALVNFLKSSILSKVVMALTGVILVLYVLGHMAGNLQIFAGQDQLNTYAVALHSTGALLWIIRAFLLICFFLHIITSLYLKKLNLDARPDKYVYNNTVQATLSSRTMIWTGLLVFFFVLYHVLHFTTGDVQPENFKDHFLDAAGRPDVYTMVILGFKNVLVSISYILAVIFLAFHLNHAMGSMFQTLGINHPTYTPIINKSSVALSVIIAIGYLSIPLSVLFGIIKLPEGVM